MVSLHNESGSGQHKGRLLLWVLASTFFGWLIGFGIGTGYLTGAKHPSPWRIERAEKIRASRPYKLLYPDDEDASWWTKIMGSEQTTTTTPTRVHEKAGSSMSPVPAPSRGLGCPNCRSTSQHKNRNSMSIPTRNIISRKMSSNDKVRS